MTQTKSQLIFSVLILCLSIFYLSGCFSLPNKIMIQDDYSQSSRRIEYNYSHHNFDWSSPLLTLNRSIIQEIEKSGEKSLTFYDELKLQNRSFRLSDKIYLMVDGKVFSITPIEIEHDQEILVKTNKEDIMKADSTTVSVVTDYTEDTMRITRFSYAIPNQIIGQLKNAKQVVFQYYAGPKILTIEMKNTDLSKLKKMLEME